ncbi:bifunctional NAD(P)H-hydrate repair enzyme [Labrys miyagiensis]|uniref:Bifunctional NAD(P)H-hydrate repair enzyme n=1 Tax=Labrys miyagiensis TaxID=346912 RepID=A0ABQ6CF78_9HYPH|nr:bifunctional NAD(P)H-hydrate repair enzyme [Labrys miyagiensis]
MIELLSPSEMADADRLAIAETMTAGQLLERAGRAVADAASRWPFNTPILVLCGTGLNGGDGFVAARILRERGYRVRLGMIGLVSSLGGEVAYAAEQWGSAIEDAFTLTLPREGIVIDALLGAGLSRDITGPLAGLIERVNVSGLHVIAVDLPSGIDGSNGQIRGVAIKAQETVTFFRRKPGHLLVPGKVNCGAVRVADIGISDSVLETIKPKTFANQPALWRQHFPHLMPEGHKYARGHLVVLSAGIEGTGAARLAAKAGLRAGAGLVTVASPSDALPIHAAALDAIMVRRCDGLEGFAAMLEDKRRNAFVIGPALPPDEETRSRVDMALGSNRAVVVDAGALTAFAAERIRFIATLRAAKGAIVLTPHEGEFERVFEDIASRHASKLERARAAAEATGAVVLLKGADTVVAAPDGRAAINANAPPTLATAGSGDVLSGLIGGLLAQAMPAFDAACAGVWLHGEAANQFGLGLTADDLHGMLPKALAGLAQA